MIVAGLEKSSVVDFPGTVAAVVFVQGCNFDCWYCHNRSLLGKHPPQTACSSESVLRFLQQRRGLLGGVVISGGEPTLQNDLPAFIEKVRALDYRVKLDTNGSRPDVLSDLIQAGVVDYIAMDVKAPLEKYPETACVRVVTGSIMKSIELLRNSQAAHEFRTTFVPTLSAGDIHSIARLIEGAPLFALQQYRRPALTKTNRIELGLPPHGQAAMDEAVRLASPYVRRCIVRGAGSLPRMSRIRIDSQINSGCAPDIQ